MPQSHSASLTDRAEGIGTAASARPWLYLATDWVRGHRILLAICVVSLLVRLALPVFLTERASGIAAYQAMTALSVANGEGFHVDRQGLEKVFALQQDEGRLLDMEDIVVPTDLAFTEPSTDYPPGYPLLLAATFKATGQARYVYVQILALVIDSVAAPLLLFYLGMRLFSRRVGLIAAVLYALWTSFAYLAFEPRPEALLSSVSLGLLITLYLFLRQGSWRWIALMALLIAIGVNLRSDMFSLVPFLALAVILAVKGSFKLRVAKGAAVGAVLIVAAFGSLVPYGFTQHEAFGRFSFTTPALAINIWQGIGEYPNPWGAVMNDVQVGQLLATQGLGYATPEGESYLWGRIRDAVSEDPLWFVGTAIDRAKRILLMQYNWGFPRAIKNALDIPGRQVSAHCESWGVLPGGSTTCLGLAVGYVGTARFLVLMDWSLWIGAIAGVVLYYRRYPYAWLLLVLPLARLIPFSFIHVEPRYILYGMAPSLIFVAALLVSGWQSRDKLSTAMRSLRPRQRSAV